MPIEVKEYTYETMPDYTEEVEGAKEVVMTGDEIAVEYIPDVVYDIKDGVELHLQILMPKTFNEPTKKRPCVVYVQGSAWKKQNCYRDVPNLARLATRGYTCCIVEYRHSGIAHFPAQIIDAKNAIRFMRSKADEYNVDVNHVIIMGNSSGGHTSAIVGMTANTDLLDEPMNDESIQVDGIIDLYGAVEVTLPYGFPGTLNHQLPDSPEGMLMGYNIRENYEKAQVANAYYYANLDYSPMLIMHGSKDKVVYCEESVNLYKAVKAEGKDVEFYIVRNADHGGPAFFKEEVIDIYDKFIQRCINK